MHRYFLLQAIIVVTLFVTFQENCYSDVAKKAVVTEEKNVDTSLVAWWSFDEGSGDRAEDKSGNGNHAKIHGARWTKGLFGSALKFNGISDFVDCGNGASLYPAQLTVEAWVKADAPAGMILSSYNGNYKGYALDSSRFSVFKGAAEDPSAEYSLGAHQWSYIVGTFDGKTIRIYKNGEEQSSFPQTELANSGFNVIIGKAAHYDGSYFGGVIDEIKIYKRALSKEEIAKSWEKAATEFGFSVKTAPLPAMILQPAKGIVVAAADYSLYNHLDNSHTNQSTISEQIKKIIDLSNLSETDWQKIEAVRLNMFMYCEDGKGDGLNESFDVVVNGQINTFPTKDIVQNWKGWGWFQCMLPINWFGFSIPKQQLVRGKNEIVVRKSANTKDNDDRIHVGIDCFDDLHGSFRSTNNGRTWDRRPLNNSDFAGEYMIRLTLYSDKSLIAAESFSQDDLVPLPAVDMVPLVKPLAAISMNEKVVCQSGKEKDILENGMMRAVFVCTEGVLLKELIHKPAGINVLRNSDGAKIFVLDVDGRRITSQDFKLVRKDLLVSDPDRQVLIYELVNDATGITARLTFAMDNGSELKVGLALKNKSSAIKLVKTAFPVLTGISWNDDCVDDYFLFPYYSGVISSHPSKLISAYGGGVTYFQQMVSYSPRVGGALLLRVDDQSGEYKVLHLTKADKMNPEPTCYINPVLIDSQNGRAESGESGFEPFEMNLGTNMAFSYFGRNMEPNEQWIFATATIGLINGDWHGAMDSYKKWFESFSHKNRYPNKLTNAFVLDGSGPETCYRLKGEYNPNPHKWGDHPLTHVTSDYIDKPIDVVEYSSYWEHDKVTDEYIKENTAIAKKYGKEFVLWPDRNGVLEGVNVCWGNQGDYGLGGYNERWGGLPAFRKYLDDVKKQGYVATLYMNKAEAGLSTVLGRKYGLQWGVILSDGSYYWPYFMPEMCTNNPLWRSYFADTCKRLITETHADGIRIDEGGGASRVCYSTQHTHTFSTRPGQYAELQAQADLARQVRMAMDEVDADTVLLAESPGIDVLGQYLDGCLSYSLTTSPLTGSVAGNWEGVVGIDIDRFYFPRCKIFDYQMPPKPGTPAWRFFNGTGSMNREWSYLDHEENILKDNSDAFGSLEPMPLIPTLASMVYVNKFPADGKTVYTIYNARKTKFSGELLAVNTVDGRHFVDLYNYGEVKTAQKDGKTVLNFELDGRAVSCVAYLPQLLSVKRTEQGLRIKVNKTVKNASVKVFDLKGKTIAESGLDEKNSCILTIPADRLNGKLCKLYSGKTLVDAEPIK